ncbi:MAG: hypothetical protein H6757_06730, partial [Candidatus Omnitrophica bacterium]|nr:hypothetical protein [Candidatus Omnitrophota bacterium]
AAATSSVSDDPLPAEKKSGQNADPSTSAIEHPAPIIKSPVGYGATIPSQKTDYGSSLKAQTAMEQTGKTISQDKNRQQEVTAPHPSSAEQIQQNRQNSGSNIPPTDTDRSIPPESPASNSSGSVLPSAEKSVTTPASANTYGGSGTFLFTGSGGSGSSSVSGGSGGGTGLSSYWRGIISGSTRLTSIASAASKMLSTKTASDDVIKVSEPMVKLDVSHHEGPPEAEDLQNRLKEDSEEKTVTSESHGAPEPYALELTIRQKQRLMDFQRKLNMRLQKMKASRSRH